MKPTWKGTIKLGFVTQPVAVFGAAESKATTTVSFNQLHHACGGRITTQVYCPACAVDVDRSDLDRGFEHVKGRYVTVSDAELESCQIETTKVIDLKEFVPLDQIQPFYIAETHYIAPDNPGLAEAFALIRDALAGVAGVGTLAIGNKEKLIAVVAHGRGLMMHTLRHASEVRAIADVDTLAAVPASCDAPTLTLMRQLVTSMTTARLDLEKYPNTYVTQVQALIATKVARSGGESPASTVPHTPTTPVVTMIAQLAASLAAVQATKPKAAKAKAPTKRKAA